MVHYSDLYLYILIHDSKPLTFIGGRYHVRIFKRSDVLGNLYNRGPNN